jgi:hypothetical protein
VQTYGIIKIKGSIHHTIAKLEHYFTIAFSGAFLAFFSAKRAMTLSKLISAENFTQIGFRGFGKNYQEEPSCLVLPTCLRKNINQLKVKLKSIYQNLVETTFDTNNYCRPTLPSLVSLTCTCPRCHHCFFFFYLSQSLSRHLLCLLDYNLFNLHVAMCDNDNVVTDEVKLINKLLTL